MQNHPSVSVIIPSFNRAHLLNITVPSYLQENVLELIIVDDCSTDNTEQVVKELQLKYQKIKYIRNSKNEKQSFSKNVGIENAQGEYIYFGDDDSIITKDTIRILLDTLREYDADCVGARALYAGNYVNSDNLKAYINWKTKKDTCQTDDICNIKKMQTNFHLNCLIPIQVPILPACALVRSGVARLIKFDIHYLGCAYCEETDFFIRATLAGYKIIFQPNAVQVNMPPYLVRNSGAHAEGHLKWQESAIKCSNYFLDKNWKTICTFYDFSTTKEEMQDIFKHKISVTSKKMRFENMIKIWLKKIYFRFMVMPFYMKE
jgi:glycosyltransferase involved in cell wall biosynthesis